MTKYLISFPSAAVDVADDELRAMSEDSHTVVREAKAAGVWVFGGGIDDSVPPALVDGDGTVTAGTHPQTRQLEGGYAILELPSYDDAVAWAARLATACRCPQELRAFAHNPES